MNAIKRWILTLFVGMGLAAVMGCTQQPKMDTTKVNVLEMRSVPDGHFLARFDLRGQRQMLNFEFKNGSARCVNSSDPKLKGLHGRFEWIGNGVFMVSMQNENYRATQFWVFREEGGAFIKEIPDRGEQQEAVPVDDDSIEPREMKRPSAGGSVAPPGLWNELLYELSAEALGYSRMSLTGHNGSCGSGIQGRGIQTWAIASALLLSLMQPRAALRARWQ